MALTVLDGTHYVDQVGLEFRDLPAFGLQSTLISEPPQMGQLSEN